MEKISLCIISKNEEKLIGEMIDSAKEVVDEIILIDSCSTDKTREIARDRGARVYTENFLYDFSDLRNKAIEKATGDWILFLDCDERLEEENNIREALKTVEDEVALTLRVCSYLNGIKRSEDNYIRLIKNVEDIRFEGKIYENPYNSIVNNYGEDKIKFTDIEIKHYGSDKNIVDVKENLKRNLKVFSFYSEEEKDCKYYFDMGNEYGRIEEFREALYNYNKAFETYEKCKVNRAKLILNKAKAMYKLKSFPEMVCFIDRSLKEFKDFKDLYFLKAYGLIALCEFVKAKEALEEYRFLSKKIEYPSSEFENVIDVEEIYKKIRETVIATQL